MRRLFACAAALCLSVLSAAPAGAQVRADRLNRLADHLDAHVKAVNFDIMNWGSSTLPADPGYVGCAAGHGVKLFAADGFRYSTWCGAPAVAYGDEINFAACEMFFGVDYETARFLFSDAGRAGRDPHAAAVNLRSVAVMHSGAPAVAPAWGPQPRLLARRE